MLHADAELYRLFCAMLAQSSAQIFEFDGGLEAELTGVAAAAQIGWCHPLPAGSDVGR